MALNLNLPQPIRALILDMDGVLWKDSEALLDLPQFFDQMNQAGVKIVLATNNATRDVSQHQEKLASFGVRVEPWQIITSAMAVGYLLKKRFPQGGPVYIFGQVGLINTLQEYGFYHAEENPLAVVASINRQVSFDRLAEATLLIRSGVPFYGTNPDRSFPTPRGLVPGSGAFIALLETASDVTAILGGKPEPVMYQMAIENLGLTPSETLAVGDRLETDILGGVRAQCPTALVLSGVATPADLEKWSPKPTFVFDNLADLLKFV